MIGYRALGHADAPTGDVTTDPATYAHPSAALRLAETYARQDGSDGALLELVQVDGGVYGCCCPTCFVAVGGVHDCTGRAGDRVSEWEAVYRPQNEVRS